MSDVKTIKQGFIRAAAFMGAVGVILAIDTLTGDFLSNLLGIYPRRLSGLDGVIFAPLLHGDFGHYSANFIPMVVLLGLLFANPNYKPWRSLACIWIVGGIGTWIIGRPPTHIGASIIIFGLISFLIVAALRLRSFRSIAISIIVFLVYGGTMIFGILPPIASDGAVSRISWEGHLSGAIGGVIAAWRVRS